MRLPVLSWVSLDRGRRAHLDADGMTLCGAEPRNPNAPRVVLVNPLNQCMDCLCRWRELRQLHDAERSDARQSLRRASRRSR